ncbi:uncharacterized protein B0H18DRAFT_661890 [Fomitopsis serialis]|uniref:uncharacterized protein n=1 Tax=Fomitopsis serialis TaxID=139415 RepID=UPI002007C3BD|nr:uncharacterized protein B0H18DRAFT_661890 [Neoantrodia serialis]KAH9918631.1 hypothetical protein B0H18DRAFT_661890 [Neoantrodia serialis]
MPKVPKKQEKVLATVLPRHRYTTRAVTNAKLRGQLHIAAQIKRDTQQTSRSRKNRAVRSSNTPDAEHYARRLALLPSARRKPSVSPAKKVSFAPPDDRSETGSADGRADARVKHENDDSSDAATDADGDTDMGDDDRGEIDDVDARNREPRRVPIARRRGMVGDNPYPLPGPQAGPVNPGLNPQMYHGHMPGIGFYGNPFLGQGFEGAYGMGPQQPFFGEYGQAPMLPFGAAMVQPFGAS